MAKLRKLREDWVTLPLSVTFRCPKVVVARQQSHAKGFVAYETNQEGTYNHFPSEWNWSKVQEIAGTSPIAVLCRNNAPIISMALKLLRDLVPVTVLGSDIGKSLVTLVKKICGKDLALPATECLTLIQHWADKEIMNALAKEKEEKVALIQDRKESLFAVIDAGKAKNLAEVILLLNDIFSEKASKVTLATGHKAKGLEWPTVVHLDPWRIPSKYAKRAAEQGNPVQLEQDLNLKYVIETRAQLNLISANLDHFQQKEAT